MLEIIVSDAGGNRLGPGPIITANNVQFARSLDGVSGWSFQIPASDERALALLQNERRIAIWEQLDQGQSPRLVGEGVIKQKTAVEAEPPMVTVSGEDLITELKDANTYLARIYNQETFETIVDDLITEVPGWTVDIEAGISSDLADAQFYGSHILKAFETVTQKYGYHYRYGATRQVEVGAFGDSNGLRIIKSDMMTRELYNNPNVLKVSQMTVTTQSKTIVNSIVPLGGGEGESALSLRESTRSGISTISKNGKTHYYIQNAASVSSYGAKWKIISFKGIQPLSNSVPDRRAAANALYDAAKNWLDRQAVMQESYTFTVNVKQVNIKPGDKIRIEYRGEVFNKNNQVVDWVDINDDYWIMSVTEMLGPSGKQARIEIRNVDSYEKDDADIVVNAIENIQLRNLAPVVSGGTPSPYIYTRVLAPGFPAIVPVEITDATLDMRRMRVRLTTSPFRATSKEGEKHYHQFGIVTPGHVGGALNYQVSLRLDTGDSFIMNIAGVFAGTGTTLETFEQSDDVPLIFEVNDDTIYPQNISVWVDGVNRTAALGGPFAPSNAPINVLLDVGLMTEYMRSPPGGYDFQGQHEIEFRAADGRGTVEVTIERYEISQDVDVTI